MLLDIRLDEAEISEILRDYLAVKYEFDPKEATTEVFVDDEGVDGDVEFALHVWVPSETAEGAAAVASGGSRDDFFGEGLEA